MVLPQPPANPLDPAGFDHTRFEALGEICRVLGASGIRLLRDQQTLDVFPPDTAPEGSLFRVSGDNNLALEIYGLPGTERSQQVTLLGQMYLDTLSSASNVECVTDALVASQDQLVALIEITQTVRRTARPEELLALLTRESMRLMNIDHAFAIFQARGKAPLYDQSPAGAIPETHIKAMAVSGRRNRAGRIFRGIHSLPDGTYHLAIIPVPVRKQIFAALGLLKRAQDDPEVIGSQIVGGDIKLGEAIADQIGAQLDSALLFEDAVAQAQLETEMELARQVQNGLLSNRLPQIGGLDLYASSIPAHQVGGDFFDFIQRADGQLVFFLGDVTGKGMPAALTMTMTRTIARSNAMHMPLTRPDELASRINEDLYDHLSNVVMFSTMFIGIYNPAPGLLTYTCAGHSPVYRVRAGEDPLLIEPDDVPIGVLDGVPFSSHQLEMKPGDALVVATDGYNESRSGADEMFGYDRMAAALKARAAQNASDIAQGLLTDVLAFSGGHPQDDDRTILILRLTGITDG